MTDTIERSGQSLDWIAGLDCGLDYFYSYHMNS